MMEPHRRIAVVHITLGESGELREHLTSLVVSLPRRHYEVTVVGPLVRALRDELSRAGIRWVNMPIDTLGAASAARQLQRLVTGRGAGIVHAHGLPAGIIAAKAVRPLPRPPAMVLTGHGLCVPQTSGVIQRMIQRRTQSQALQRFDRVLVESQVELGALHALDGRASIAAEIIQPGIDRNRYRHTTDPGVKRRMLGLLGEAALVGVVAPTVTGQGLESFLHAAALITADLPNVEFVIVGEGALNDALQALAHDLKISGSVVFLADRPDAAEIIAAMNVLVVPGPSCGGMLRALQALSLRIPIVAIEGGSVHELLAELKEVVCVRPEDAEALAAGIREQLEVLPAEEAHPTAVSAAGLTLTHDDFLVAREEYDLDQQGLERRSQLPANLTPAQRMLERLDIRHFVANLARIYNELLEDPGAAD